MCGIAGLMHLDRRPVALRDLDAMGDAIRHRGPDQHGVWTATHPAHAIGLVHRRLAIRDRSEAGRQPLASRSGGTVLDYNGEIYNDAALAERLAREHGMAVRSTCDSEVLAELLDKAGADAIPSLNGIYAFAAYDVERGTLLLVRDPVGVKPLYLWRDPAGRALAFASEVKAFLPLPAFQRAVDPLALAALLAQGYTGPERSLMRDVTPLQPGQVLRVAPDGSVRELFRMGLGQTPAREEQTEDAPAAARRLTPLFEAAVARQRVSDVPLVVWQSGGVDSSLVNAACAAPRPEALTVTSAQADFDESADAARAAQTLGAAVTPVALEERAEPPSDAFAALVWHTDGELADSSALAVKRLSAATKPFATVALSGDGADELFGGYATYRATRLAARLGRHTPARLARFLARRLLRGAANASQRYPKAEWAGRLLQGLPQGALAHAEWRRYAMPWDLEALFSAAPSVDPLDGYRRAVADARAARPGADPAGWGQSADLAYYLPGDMLMKVDRMSMAHGLEVRVPFLDLAFLDEVLRLAPALRLPQGARTKPVLRAMLAGYGFPRDLVERGKTGFNVPLAMELRTTYKGVMTDLLLRGDLVQPWLDPDAVRRLCQDHLSGAANHGYLLWSLMTFAQWRRHLGQ